jgi:alkaline phosphatase D
VISRAVSLAFATLVLLTAMPTALAPARPVAFPEHPAVLVTVAEVHENRATLWVRAEGGAPVRVRYRPEGARASLETSLEPDAGRDDTAHVVLRGLGEATRYVYEVEHESGTVTGQFATAPRASESARTRILWSADLGGAGHCRDVEDGYRIFHAMRRRAADLFLFLGDTIYADHTCGGQPGPGVRSVVATSLGDFHGKHRENREDHAVQRFLRSTPVYAIWDDHEVANNFSAPRHPLALAGLAAFRDYWAIDGPAEEPARLYRRVRWGRHVEIFILDTRQYRSSNRAEDGPGKSMLGVPQRRWLLDGLTGSDATWKVVVTTVPLGMFTGGRASDSWSNMNALGFARPGSGFVWERDLILRTLREHRVANVVFLSGDVHHAELVRHEPEPGHVVHEFVAGPLAARQGFPRFLDRSLGSRSLGGLGWSYNFGEIEADGEQLTARIFDTAGTLRVTTRLHASPGHAIAAR